MIEVFLFLFIELAKQFKVYNEYETCKSTKNSSSNFGCGSEMFSFSCKSSNKNVYLNKPQFENARYSNIVGANQMQVTYARLQYSSGYCDSGFEITHSRLSIIEASVIIKCGGIDALRRANFLLLIASPAEVLRLLPFLPFPGFETPGSTPCNF